VRVRVPDAAELVAAPHLAALAVLEVALVATAHAVRAALPAVDRGPFPGDPVELVTARILVDECDALLGALDDHRVHVMARLRRAGVQPDWPF
jgi:hypothetical protein